MMILIIVAFISGILTTLTPCVLPILPVVLSSGIDGNKKRIKGFILGLIFSFVIISLSLATIVRVFGVPADIVRLFAVWLLIFFGISLVFPIIWEKVQLWIERYWRFQPVQKEGSGFGGGFITGISLGIVWTPCIGPIIATVATLAAVGSFSISMIFILLAYGVGAGIALYYIALGGSAISQKLTFIKNKNKEIRQILGIIILATALFIWSGTDRLFQAWTLSNLPDFWTQLPTKFEESINVDSEINRTQPRN